MSDKGGFEFGVSTERPVIFFRIRQNGVTSTVWLDEKRARAVAEGILALLKTVGEEAGDGISQD